MLICPGCQTAHDWTADLDRCTGCGGIHLVRRLGETECKDCGTIRDPDAVPGPAVSGSAGLTPGLAEEVEQALARVLGRAQRPAGIS